MNLKYKLMSIKYSIKYAYQRAKRGYDDRALYNTTCWFRETIIPILKWHKDNHHHILINPDNNEKLTNEETKKIFMLMIYFIKYSDSDKYLDDWNKVYKFTQDEINNANKLAEGNKNRFFEIFSKYFYQLCDYKGVEYEQYGYGNKKIR